MPNYIELPSVKQCVSSINIVPFTWGFLGEAKHTKSQRREACPWWTPHGFWREISLDPMEPIGLHEYGG